MPAPGQPVQPSTVPAPPGLRLSVPSRQRRSVVLKRGLLVKPACKVRSRVTLTLKLGKRTLGRKTLSLVGKHATRLRLTRKGRALVRKHPRRKLLLTAAARSSAGVRQTVRRHVSLR